MHPLKHVFPAVWTTNWAYFKYFVASCCFFCSCCCCTLLFYFNFITTLLFSAVVAAIAAAVIHFCITFAVVVVVVVALFCWNTSCRLLFNFKNWLPHYLSHNKYFFCFVFSVTFRSENFHVDNDGKTFSMWSEEQ